MKTLITLLFCSLIAVAHGQNSFVLASQYHGGEVVLRWAPSNYDNWLKGINEGYKIVRYTLKENGVG